MSADLFARLAEAAEPDWRRYTEHAFVRRMGEGSLPEAAFRAYLVQDYLFLLQFARANALAVYKSRSLADMRAALGGLQAILDVEIDLHLRLCARWGLQETDLEGVPEHAATTAYTRFVLDCGAAGDLLDLHVALAPCVVGYGVIAKRLAPHGVEALGSHPYREWIAEYAGEPYQEVVAKARWQIDALAERALTPRRFPELARTFAAASRLEAAFWQMGLDAAGNG